MPSISRLYSEAKEYFEKNYHVLLFFIFFIFLALRVFAWKNTILFEGHGSLSKLYAIKVFLTFSLQNIINTLLPDD